MNLNLTQDERDLLIDALEVYRDFLVDLAEDAEDDETAPDFSALDNRAKTLIMRLEVAHQITEVSTPLREALKGLAEKEDDQNETEEGRSKQS